MAIHGGGFASQPQRRPIAVRCTGSVGNSPPGPQTPLTGPTRPAGVCPAIEDGAGFRHFLRPPEDHERCRFFLDPKQPVPGSQVRGTLSRLVKHMRSAPLGGDHGRDNPDIPSGYTYLLQFVAHDLVQSSVALSTDQRFGSGVRNLRRSLLQLDTLYGGGPMVTPLIYAIDEPTQQTRTRFRIGRMRGDGAAQDGQIASGPRRDIARAQGEGPGGEALAGASEALVADRRNDDQAIVSQLTVVFKFLHNAILMLLPPPPPNDPFPESTATRRFLCAREATTLIYRRVIRHDLLRRLLQPSIFERYRSGTGPFLDPGDEGMPLEFSHAAFRIGHAMIRDGYVFNRANAAGTSLEAVLTRSSGRAPQDMPLDRSWIVQWSGFFDLGTVPANLSQRIAPLYSSGLSSEEIFPHVDETQELGLAYRDLISAAASGLWSVGSLIDAIRLAAADALDGAPLLTDADARHDAVAQWLAASIHGPILSPSQAAALAADPPLAFFIPFEAAQQAAGTRLGTLGSLIVAEVMFRALGPDPQGTLFENLVTLSRTHLNEAFTKAVPDILDMSSLIKFVADEAGLTQASPAFV